MSIKHRYQLVTVGAYGLMLLMLPLIEYVSNHISNSWWLLCFLPILFGIIMLPLWYAKRNTVKVLRLPDYVPSGEPVLEIKNNFEVRDYLVLVLNVLSKFALLILVLYCSNLLSVLRPAVIGALAASPLLIAQYVSQRKSTYTFRSDRLIVKEYTFGRLTADLDIPLDSIDEIRYMYHMTDWLQLWLVLSVNGHRLELHTYGCAERLAQEIIARQTKP